MAPSLYQIRILATLKMSSFALEAREEFTGHLNPLFLQEREPQIDELLGGSLLRFNFGEVITILSSFSRFWRVALR